MKNMVYRLGIKKYGFKYFKDKDSALSAKRLLERQGYKILEIEEVVETRVEKEFVYFNS